MPQKIFNTCDVDVTSVPQSVSVNRGTSPAQLSLFPESASSQHLTVEAVPPDQRVTPDQERYILVLKPSGLRVAGQFFGGEIDQTIATTKGWRWTLGTLDSQGRQGILEHFELLIDQVLGGE